MAGCHAMQDVKCICGKISEVHQDCAGTIIQGRALDTGM